MKYIKLLALFISSVFYAQAQYEPFLLGEDAHYATKIGSEERKNVYALRIDSLVNHSMATEYVMMQGTDLPSFQDHWCGNSVVATDDGRHLFFSADGDTMTIRTNAAQFDNWLAFEDDRIKIELTYVGHEEVDVLGVIDSVKFFDYTIKEKFGGEHQFEHQIGLSKNHGYISFITPNTRFNGSGEYIYWQFDLIGISKSNLGYQNLLFEDVFDFEVGDIFHISRAFSTYENYFYIFYDISIVQEVIEKVETDSSYRYKIFETKYVKKEGTSVSMEILCDTVIKEFSKSLIHFDDLSQIPKGDKIVQAYQTTFGRSKRSDYQVYLFPYDGYPFYPGHYDEYIEHGGGPYFKFEQGETNYRLLQYKRAADGREYGTPIDTTEFTGIENYAQIKRGRKLQIQPNPVVSNFFVKLDPEVEAFDFILYNMLGQPVLATRIQGTERQLRLPVDLSPGRYIGRAISSEGKSYSEVLIRY